MLMRIWDSESESQSHDITEDPFFIKLDDVNGVLRINDYEANGMHTTVMLFVGPDAEENSAQFDAFTESEDEETGGLSLNTDTEAMIKKCFGLD
jgi:hypothetical protein